MTDNRIGILKKSGIEQRVLAGEDSVGFRFGDDVITSFPIFLWTIDIVTEGLHPVTGFPVLAVKSEVNSQASVCISFTLVGYKIS